MARPLEEQFEHETVERIRTLIATLNSLGDYEGAGRYYISEVKCCLECGLLLAALQVVASLLELFVRDLLIQHRMRTKTRDSNSSRHSTDLYERAVEENRQFTFGAIIRELQGQGVITVDDAESVRSFYKSVRVPLHHGLSRRYVRLQGNFNEKDILDQALSLSRIPRFHRMEEMIEDTALDHLESVVNFIASYSVD